MLEGVLYTPPVGQCSWETHLPILLDKTVRKQPSCSVTLSHRPFRGGASREGTSVAAISPYLVIHCWS